MSIEFDKTGFAAVDALFGAEEPSEEVKRGERSAIESSQRLGVGAKAIPSNRDPIATTILQVGRKRQRGNEHQIDENTHEVAIQDENDEDDLGRTAIKSSNPKFATETAADVAPLSHEIIMTNNKRKKGKKERAMKNQSTNEEEGNHDATVNNLEKSVDADQDSKANPSSSKRKRRKVRSKQKNIYKDQRVTKPEHLIVGHKNYQGRPLTAETRAKLNLSEPKSSYSFSGTWTGAGSKENARKSQVENGSVE